MGMSVYFYLGPYVTCVGRATKVEIEVFGCTNASCEAYSRRSEWVRGGVPFCAQCGHKTGTSIKTETRSSSVYDVLGDDILFECCCKGERRFLLPNVQRGERSRKFTFSQDGGGDVLDGAVLYNEASIQPGPEKEWLRQNYAPEISALTTTFDNVEVLWGLLTYAL